MKNLTRTLLLAVSLAAPSLAMAAPSTLKASFTDTGRFVMRNVSGPGSLHEVDPVQCRHFAQGTSTQLHITEYPHENDRSVSKTITAYATDTRDTSLPQSLCEYAIRAGFQVSHILYGTLNQGSLTQEANYIIPPANPLYKVFNQSINEDDYIMTPVRHEKSFYKVRFPARACARPLWNTTLKMGFYKGDNTPIDTMQYTEAQVKADPLLTQISNIMCDNSLKTYNGIIDMKQNDPQFDEAIHTLNTLIN